MPQRAGGGDDFQHQFAEEFFPARVGEQFVGGQNRTRVSGCNTVTERGQSRHGHAGLLRPAQRFEKHALQFQRLAAFEINERGRLVSAHRPRAFDLFFGIGNGNFKPQRAGGGNDFQHQFAQEFFPARVGEQFVGGQEPAEGVSR